PGGATRGRLTGRGWSRRRCGRRPERSLAEPRYRVADASGTVGTIEGARTSYRDARATRRAGPHGGRGGRRWGRRRGAGRRGWSGVLERRHAQLATVDDRHRVRPELVGDGGCDGAEAGRGARLVAQEMARVARGGRVLAVLVGRSAEAGRLLQLEAHRL